MDMQQELLGWESGLNGMNGLNNMSDMPPYQLPSMSLGNSLRQPEFALDPAFFQDPAMSNYDPFEPLSATTTMNPMDSKLPPLHHGGSSIESDTSPQSSSAL